MKTISVSIPAFLMSQLLLLASGFAAAEGASPAMLTISDAYVRDLIPGRSMTAGFMTLHNPSGKPVTLTRACARWASSIELHTHTHEDGVMRMREIDTIEIPAGKTVSLEPGGLHLMIFGVEAPMAESLELMVCFDNEQCQSFSADLVDIRD
jgi:copper(I)-binding protein